MTLAKNTTGVHTAERAAPGGTDAEGSLSLDNTPNKSELPKIIPQRSGGKLDPKYGVASRFQDLMKFRRMLTNGGLWFLITLTVDRRNFDSPAAAYDHCMRHVSDLFRLLGITVWGRVLEMQTKTGDGWAHWHVVVDLQGTQWETRPGWVDMAGLAHALQRLWRYRWKIGSPDLERVRSVERCASYLSKYVVKPWPAIPRWILNRKMVRLVGFSKAFNQRHQLITGEQIRKPSKKDHPTEKKHERGRLLERLASSGLSCVMVAKGQFFGVIEAPYEFIKQNIGKLTHTGIELLKTTVGSHGKTYEKESVVVTGEPMQTGAKLQSTLVEVPGLSVIHGTIHAKGNSLANQMLEFAQDKYREALDTLWNGWERMQVTNT